LVLDLINEFRDCYMENTVELGKLKVEEIEMNVA